MRTSSCLNLIALFLLIACSALTYAQEPRQEENRAPRQQEPRTAEPRQPEARPEPRPEPPRDDTNAPRQDEARPPRQDRQEQRRENQRSRDQMRPAPERGQGHQRPAGRSARIPDDRFRQQFGRSHSFAVRPVVVSGGQQGFIYSGYTFVFLDPWPEDWAYDDGYYVDDMDGDYYLYDLMHPGMRIALFVVE
jgi:cell division protein FtsN